MSLDAGNHRDASQSSGDGLARLDSSNGVRKARVRAEVEFCAAEGTGAAARQRGQRDLGQFMTSHVGVIPPHWQAGTGHACARSPPKARHSTKANGYSDFETSRRHCACVAAKANRQRKLIP